MRDGPNTDHFWDDVNSWFEHELAKFDPSPDEAALARDDFNNRERDVWTVATYKKHMEDLIIGHGLGMTV